MAIATVTTSKPRLIEREGGSQFEKDSCIVCIVWVPRLESAQALRDGQEGTGAHACRTLGMMPLLKKGCVRLEVENGHPDARAAGPLRSERSCGEGREKFKRGRYGIGMGS